MCCFGQDFSSLPIIPHSYFSAFLTHHLYTLYNCYPSLQPNTNFLTSLFLLSSLFLLTNLPYRLIPTNRPRFASVKYSCKFNENSITLTLERTKDGFASFELRVYSSKSHNQSLAIGLSLRLMLFLLFLSELVSKILQVRREVAFLTVEGQSTARHFQLST